jgi:hypothetical protein
MPARFLVQFTPENRNLAVRLRFDGPQDFLRARWSDSGSPFLRKAWPLSGDLGNLCRTANASTADLDDLLGDDLGNGIVAINQTERMQKTGKKPGLVARCHQDLACRPSAKAVGRHTPRQRQSMPGSEHLKSRVSD